MHIATFTFFILYLIENEFSETNNKRNHLSVIQFDALPEVRTQILVKMFD